MAVVMKLVRRPRSASYRKKVVSDEIRAALDAQASKAVDRLMQDVADWEEQPEFVTKVTASGTKVTFSVSVDGRTKIGKIYQWVDQGTGERGNAGGEGYWIEPKKEGYPLGPFMVPHGFKTIPNPVIDNFPDMSGPRMVSPSVVWAPGIYPRNFTTRILEEMRGTGQNTFRNIIDAAIKRGLRR